MCTVSVIPFEDGFRLACNRDELLARPAALPPETRRFGGHDAILPVDPSSDGTWVAVSDAGIAFALLNVNPALRRALPQSPRLSRGLIIPELLHCDDVPQVLCRAREIDPSDFPPFRLIAVTPQRWGEVFSDGRQTDFASRPFDGAPIMFTSSGLGDDLVEFPRRMLFDRIIRSASNSSERQDEFHDHQWPDCPQLGVRMNRADARTVSQTTIELAQGVATLRYIAGRYDRTTKLHLLALEPA